MSDPVLRSLPMPDFVEYQSAVLRMSPRFTTYYVTSGDTVKYFPEKGNAARFWLGVIVGYEAGTDGRLCYRILVHQRTYLDLGVSEPAQNNEYVLVPLNGDWPDTGVSNLVERCAFSG